MGMDYPTVDFITSSAYWSELDDRQASVLTIGRQNWWLSKREARKLSLLFQPPYSSATYCEDFWLTELNCSKVESVDIVPDEQPTYIADLSERHSLAHVSGRKHWNVVCEFGTAEHVADQFTFWENISEALVENSRLFVVVPCDALAGHGLYQFSPEFFYRMRGYAVVRCGTYTYSPFGRYRKFDSLSLRHQRSYKWPTFVFAELVRTQESFQLPQQGFTTVTHRKTPPWASALVEIPGIRILERIIRR